MRKWEDFHEILFCKNCCFCENFRENLTKIAQGKFTLFREKFRENTFDPYIVLDPTKKDLSSEGHLTFAVFKTFT
jgi:hypothetical protein